MQGKPISFIRLHKYFSISFSETSACSTMFFMLCFISSILFGKLNSRVYAGNILREIGFVSRARARVSSRFFTIFISNYITIHFYKYFGLLGLPLSKALYLSGFCGKLNALLWFTFWFTWFTSLIVKKCSSVYPVYHFRRFGLPWFTYISSSSLSSWTRLNDFCTP